MATVRLTELCRGRTLMNPVLRLYNHLIGIPIIPEGPTLAAARGHAQRTVTTTIMFGMDMKESQLGILEHSAQVAMIAGWLGERMDVSEPDAYVLRTAAELHEVGMFGVDPALLMQTSPLSPEELATVRSQALVSARLAATMHGPRVALLIEGQYDDHAAQEGETNDPDRLLAGILRVADVIAAVRNPRPYQDALTLQQQERLLQRGSGTRFHPLAVQYAMAG